MSGTATYNERHLLEQVAAGDQAAFAELFEQHRARIFYTAWKVLKSDSVAEDVLQDIFITVWTHREQLTGIGSFTSWLNTITRNQLVNRLRRQTRQLRYINETLYRDSDKSEDLFETVVWNELHSILLQAVQLLSPQQRKVFELDRFEGLKHAEIAERLGISKGTVKNHMMEAVKNIKAHFKASGKDLELLTILLLTLSYNYQMLDMAFA